MAVNGTTIRSPGVRNVDHFKHGHFDSDAVIRAMTKASRKAQTGAAAFIRTSALTSIKKAPKVDAKTGLVKRGRRKKGVELRDAVAKPGDPPFEHKGTRLLKRLLVFAWDEDTQSTVIGPQKINNPRGGGPEFLEHGGQTTIADTAKKASRAMSFSGNPFMAPALESGLSQYLAKFENSMEKETT